MRYQESLKNNTILLADLYTPSLARNPLIREEHSLIIRDVMQMEDGVRREKSRHISFEDMISLSESLSDIGDASTWEDLITGLSIIGDIYRAVPERPKGENNFPPGDFGETYFITQGALWHRGYRWLIFGAEKLRGAYEKMSFQRGKNPIEERQLESLKKNILLLIEMSWIERANTSIVITITPENTRISYIPRDVRGDIHDIIRIQGGKK